MKLYGIAEIAAALGVSRGLVAKWNERGRLPEPDQRLAAGPVWFEKTIAPWLKEQR